MYVFPPYDSGRLSVPLACGLEVLLLIALAAWLLRYKRYASNFDPLLILVIGVPIILGGWELAHPVDRRLWTDEWLPLMGVPAVLALVLMLISLVRLWWERAGVLPAVLMPIATAILTCWIVTSLQPRHPAGIRSVCGNNLKQVGMGMLNYYASYGTLPRQTLGDPAVSWRVTLLPFSDSLPVFNLYDPTQP